METKKGSPGKDCDISPRFIEDRYSKADIEYIIKHQQEEGSVIKLERTCKTYWYQHFNNQVTTEEETNFESMLDSIHHKLNLELESPIGHRSIGPVGRIIRSSLKVYCRVAAIIVLGLILAGLYDYISDGTIIPDQKTVYSEVVAPMGSRIKVDLPDGSTAWLNHGSILRYPNKYGRKSRELHLSGEAYFNVKKEEFRPFIVRTSDVNIHVLGTTFNVMAYEDERDVEVTLETGRLDLYSLSGEQSSGRIASLKPGERIVINRDNKTYTMHYGNTDVQTSWKDGRMIFREDPMAIIVKRLERWYNVDIELLNQELLDYTFTATFTDETLQQALYLLSIAVPIEYEITSSVKQNNNSYTKRKVFIDLTN
jgi:transmembrane sensor